MAFVLPLACIGHWYSDLLYLAPVGVMVGLVGVDKAKHRIKAPRDARKTRPPHNGSTGCSRSGSRSPGGHKRDAVPSARR